MPGETAEVSAGAPLHVGAWGGGDGAVLMTLTVDDGKLFCRRSWVQHATQESLAQLSGLLRPRMLQTEWNGRGGVPVIVPHALVEHVNLGDQVVTVTVDKFSRVIAHPKFHTC